MKFNQYRRTFFGAIASATFSVGALVAARSKASSTSQSVNQNESEFFQHGVASGDPLADSVVIWTRVSSTYLTPTINWQIAEDRDFKQLVNSGALTTSADVDYTVKVVVDKLRAGKQYYYRFNLGAVNSPVGKTKTLPVGKVDKLGIALASCSNYAFGYFNAYDAIARDESIDILFHTGDYIYEYGVDGWGGEFSKTIGRQHQPSHETISLEDYRLRHAQYKRDVGSQAVHAAHPIVCTWDDHESANNPWVGGAQNHQTETEGDWAKRRNAAVQAYYEWMPIRDPINDVQRLDFSRTYKFGDLATLVTMETRHTGRAEQINYADYTDSIKTKADADNFKQSVLNSSNRPMLSQKTESLIEESLQGSLQQEQVWRLIGNASPIARTLVPDVESLGVLQGETTEQLNSFFGKGLRWQGKFNLPPHTDSWDGYAWARERLYKQCYELGVQDLLFLTGDSHSFLMNRLYDESQRQMGLEIGAAGISSPGGLLGVGWQEETAARLEKAFIDENDEAVWTDNFHQGYVRLELTREQVTANFIGVSTVVELEYTTKLIKSAVIKKSGKSIDYV